jgi:hypothetical protein
MKPRKLKPKKRLRKKINLLKKLKFLRISADIQHRPGGLGCYLHLFLINLYTIVINIPEIIPAQGMADRGMSLFGGAA